MTSAPALPRLRGDRAAGTAPAHAPSPELQRFVDRFDPDRLDEPPDGRTRARLVVGRDGDWDLLVKGRRVALEPADRDARPDVTLSADRAVFGRIADGARPAMDAFRAGRLGIRGNVNLGVSLLAARGRRNDPLALRFGSVRTARGVLSTVEAGRRGDPVICIHGLGGTKASFLPTVTALAPHHRVIAVDLPGFGDSDKPLGAAYDAQFFAEAVLALMDELGIARAHLAGNSMGGRVALEVGLRAPERVGRMVLLAPSLAWLRGRRFTPLARVARPELGLLQIAPRPVVDRIVRRIVPGAAEGWTAAGVDEFLRAYCTPRGRVAFYAAARNIYLEEPVGDDGFWTRLRSLSADALFTWGRFDQVVPYGFAAHVREALPASRHLVLDCGHVPQLERPEQLHRKMLAYFAEPDGMTARSAG